MSFVPRASWRRPRSRASGDFAAEQIGGGGGSESDDDLRADNVDLAEEKLRAGVGFFGLGDAVLRRAALDDVGDVDIGALETHGDDHVVEELAGATDEGQALRVFVSSRTFADEHEAGVGVSVSENDGVAALKGERAAGAFAYVGANCLERGGAVGGRRYFRLRRRGETAGAWLCGRGWSAPGVGFVTDTGSNSTADSDGRLSATVEVVDAEVAVSSGCGRGWPARVRG